MKMIGTSNDGVVVEDWEDLSKIPTDKLIKLRDVGMDNREEAWKAYDEADRLVVKLNTEIYSRLTK